MMVMHEGDDVELMLVVARCTSLNPPSQNTKRQKRHAANRAHPQTLTLNPWTVFSLASYCTGRNKYNRV